MPARLREDPGEINAAALTPPKHSAVRAGLDAIRPGLLADGGNVELLEVEEDGTVLVQLQGACATCPSAGLTLTEVIEPRLRDLVPGVRSVLAS